MPSRDELRALRGVPLPITDAAGRVWEYSESAKAWQAGTWEIFDHTNVHTWFLSGPGTGVTGIDLKETVIRFAITKAQEHMPKTEETPKVTNHNDNLACGLCWHRVNVHNPMQGCPVANCRCTATAGEASNANTVHTPAAMSSRQIRPGYEKEEPMATTKGSHNGSNPYEDSAGRVWTFHVSNSTWRTNVMLPNPGRDPDEVELHMNRGEMYWCLIGLPGGLVNTGHTQIGDAVEEVRERIDVATLTPEKARAVKAAQEPAAIPYVDPIKDMLKQLGLPVQDMPNGAWLVTDKWQTVTVFLSEIDALRFVNAGAAGAEVEQGRVAYFVPNGTSLSQARGW